MKQQIKTLVQKAIKKLYPDIEVEFTLGYPPPGVDADFASNVALVLAKKLGEKPMEVAAALAAAIPDLIGDPGLPSTAIGGLDSRLHGNDISMEVATPGFLNFKLPAAVWQKELGQILKEAGKFGTTKQGRGKKINLEFVSANPTGPLTVGHGRGAMIGSTLARVLANQGYKVVREYYFNDGGKQMQNLAESVRLRAKELLGEQVEFPQSLYQGEYIKAIAMEYLKTKTSPSPSSRGGEKGEVIEDDWRELAKFAADRIFEGIKKTLQDLDVKFDIYFNELRLIEAKGKDSVSKVLEQLEAKGAVREKDGAQWLVGDSKESVLVRSTGEPTYRLPDIAYHVHKLNLGYDKIINVLGADHIAQFPDIQFAVKALGYDESKIEVIINQFVTLAGKKMSTRRASYVTLDELMAEAGADVTKFFMLMSAPSSHMTFDLTLAKDTSEKNPVYKVQYAHARISSILRKAATTTSPQSPPHEGGRGKGVIAVLGSDEELVLIRELVKFPELVSEISETYNVHHLPHYLLGLADKFHHFYERVRVISEDEKQTAARLALVKGVQGVLANGLRLMGIEPLEKM